MNEDARQLELSPEGGARREAMLGTLLVEVDRTRRRKTLRRGVIVSSVGLGVIVLAFIAMPTKRSHLIIDPMPLAAQPQYSHVEIVTTPADALEGKLVVASETQSRMEIVESLPVLALSSVEIVDDERLLSALAAAGRPTGLIRMDGVTRTTRDVTDEALGG